MKQYTERVGDLENFSIDNYDKLLKIFRELASKKDILQR